jgi:hypothetical protein
MVLPLQTLQNRQQDAIFQGAQGYERRYIIRTIPLSLPALICATKSAKYRALPFSHFCSDLFYQIYIRILFRLELPGSPRCSTASQSSTLHILPVIFQDSQHGIASDCKTIRSNQRHLVSHRLA